MTRNTAMLLLWAPRILGVLVSVFIGLFALDAFAHGEPLARATAEFAVHLLPAIALLITVILSWRHEWVAGVTFVALGILYAATMARGRVDWMLAISGPLLVVGVLFLWSWFLSRDISHRSS